MTDDYRKNPKTLADLTPAPYNPRSITEPALRGLKRSIEEFGDLSGITYNTQTGNLICAHQRRRLLLDMNPSDIAWGTEYHTKHGPEANGTVTTTDGSVWHIRRVTWSLIKEQAVNIAANDPLISGTFNIDFAGLANTVFAKDGPFLDLGLDLQIPDLIKDIKRESMAQRYTHNPLLDGNLLKRFGVAPFSVIDGRHPTWLERKRKWYEIGLKSWLGRENTTTSKLSGMYAGVDRGYVKSSNVSIFDPALTEILIDWFCPLHGSILDPFAGGSVRGVVSGIKLRKYTGIDLSPLQVEVNREQLDVVRSSYASEEEHTLLDQYLPEWIVGDSQNINELLPPTQEFDFVLSCPPYHNLEKYSDDPNDLSNMSYPDFIRAYSDCIRLACQRLKQDRFACFVVGEIRSDNGPYRGFVQNTISAFCQSGMDYYNEIIYITPYGSLPLRASTYFAHSRKIGKSHQNVLVFVKGDPAAAAAVLSPPLEVEADTNLDMTDED